MPISCDGKAGSSLVGEADLAGSRADGLECIHILASTSNESDLGGSVLVVDLLQKAHTLAKCVSCHDHRTILQHIQTTKSKGNITV